MKDQVDSLRANGISALYLNSSMSDEERQEAWSMIKEWSVKLIYLSPESMQAFEIIHQLTTISLIAIDEAHCISSWWHDFRPAYTQLSDIKKICPDTPIIALTATADKTARNDICRQLWIEDAKLFLSSFDRPNLQLTVRPWKKRFEQIYSFISARPNQSWIIYCLSRWSTEKVAQKLQWVGIQAEAYHAWLSHTKRQRVQDNFLSDTTQIICATIAFGMWIDKSNVRFVIHYNLPKNIEWYYQEIWRAWRDWLPSDTLLFYSYADILQLTKFAQWAKNAEVQLAKLQRMKHYAESLTCRRKILLHYFSESKVSDCWNCDVCEHPPQMFDGTKIAQKALSTIYRLKQVEPMRVVIDVLRWSKNAYIRSRWYDALSTHWVWLDIVSEDWQRYMIQLMNLWYIEIAFDQWDVLHLSETAEKVLFAGEEVQLAALYQEHVSLAPKKDEAGTRQEFAPIVDLFSELQQLRNSLALSEGVASHSLMSDVTLQDIVQKMPKKLTDLEDIQWLWHAKRKKYWWHILTLIKAHLALLWKSVSSPRWKPWTTFQKTYELVQRGKSLSEIAQERDLWIGTIYAHIARLYASWKDINLTEYISSDKLDKISWAMEEIWFTGQLKPLYSHLQWTVSYNELRLWISFAQKNWS